MAKCKCIACKHDFSSNENIPSCPNCGSHVLDVNSEHVVTCGGSGLMCEECGLCDHVYFAKVQNGALAEQPTQHQLLDSNVKDLMALLSEMEVADAVEVCEEIVPKAAGKKIIVPIKVADQKKAAKVKAKAKNK